MSGSGGGESEPPTTALRPPSLWRNRDFMLLWTSQVASTLGTRVTTVAYPLLVLAITHSPALAGVVGFAQTLPFILLYLPAGALVDRWDRKRTMIVCDGGRALALGSIAATVALGRVSLVQLVVVALVEGSLFVLFDLAEGAALPQIVPHQQLPTALAQNQAKTQGADLVGQPLGGVLLGAAPLAPFLFDAVTYVASFCTLPVIRSPFQWQRTHQNTRLRADIAEGLRFVWNHPFLRTATGVIGGLNLVWNTIPLLLIVRARDLGASPALIGTMFAFFGGGALLGSFIAPWAQRTIPARYLLVSIPWLWTAQIGVLILMPGAVTFGVMQGLSALTTPTYNVVVNNHIYGLTPDRILGRVRSSARLVAWGTIPLGMLAAGLLADALGTGATLLLVTGGMLAVAIATTAAPAIRHPPQLQQTAVDRPATPQ